MSVEELKARAEVAEAGRRAEERARNYAQLERVREGAPEASLVLLRVFPSCRQSSWLFVA